MSRNDLIKYFERVLKHYQDKDEILSASYTKGFNDGVCTVYEEVIAILKQGLYFDEEF